MQHKMTMYNGEEDMQGSVRALKAAPNARFYHRGVNRGLLKPCFNSIRGLHHRLVLSTAE